VKDKRNRRDGVTLREGKGEGPNPNGKNGKPLTIAPITFEQAVRKMLNTPPPDHKTPLRKKS